MRTSEPLIDTPFAKRVVIANCLAPAVILVWDAFRRQLGVNDVNFAIRTTGLIGLVLITLALLVTPLRALTGWNRLISVRRNLGVIAFAYLSAHFLIFFWWDRQASLVSTLNEIGMRRYLWFGTGALVLMVPLALTSTDAMVLRVGAKRWKTLQRLVYLIAVAAVLHYYLLVKSDTRQPLAFGGLIGALLMYRVVAHYMHLRAEVRAARVKAATAPVASPGRRKFWSGELTIARIFQETPDVKTFRLVSADGGTLPFSHTAGQYLNLALTIDGRRVNRSYTIASSPTRPAYCEISVKRTPDGYGSRHLHETWREGQRVKVSAPAGRFVFDEHGADRVVLIAGGIGITPMMSVLRSLTDRGWSGDIYLFHSVRRVADLVFRDELAYLHSRFSNLHVQMIVSGDQDTPWNGLRGHVTAEVIAGSVPNLRRGPVLLCGPDPMMTAVRQALVSLGIPDGEILQEAFVSPRPSDASAPNEDPTIVDRAPDAAPAILFKRSGRNVEPGPRQSVLEAAEDAGIELPFECRSGICGQCKTPLVTGRVAMEVADALTVADRARGLILACQARPLEPIVIDA